VRFVRSLCEKHGITVERDTPLYSVFGEYVKKLKTSGLIESKMTETILKSSTRCSKQLVNALAEMEALGVAFEAARKSVQLPHHYGVDLPAVGVAHQRAHLAPYVSPSENCLLRYAARLWLNRTARPVPSTAKPINAISGRGLAVWGRCLGL
jgi:hypothetical protein